MKTIQISVIVHNGDDVPDDEIAGAINNAVSFAENDGMWPYKYYVEIEDE